MGVVDLGALADQLRRNPHHPGAPQLSPAFELHRPGTAAEESELEIRFADLCRSSGLPAPERQVWLVLEDGEEGPRRVARRARHLAPATG